HAVATFTSGFTHLSGIAIDSAGDIFVSDYGTNEVYKILPGTPNTHNTFVNGFTPNGLASDSSGDLFVAVNAGSVREYTSTGSFVATLATGLTSPQGVVVSAIPEPSTTVALAGLAAFGVCILRRRHKYADR